MFAAYILSFASYKMPSPFDRLFVRLGEYDTRHENDGQHEDIDVALAVKHEQFNSTLLINDVAIIIMVRHVVFNGSSINLKMLVIKIEFQHKIDLILF